MSIPEKRTTLTIREGERIRVPDGEWRVVELRVALGFEVVIENVHAVAQAHREAEIKKILEAHKAMCCERNPDKGSLWMKCIEANGHEGAHRAFNRVEWSLDLGRPGGDHSVAVVGTRDPLRGLKIDQIIVDAAVAAVEVYKHECEGCESMISAFEDYTIDGQPGFCEVCYDERTTPRGPVCECEGKHFGAKPFGAGHHVTCPVAEVKS